MQRPDFRLIFDRIAAKCRPGRRHCAQNHANPRENGAIWMIGIEGLNFLQRTAYKRQ